MKREGHLGNYHCFLILNILLTITITKTKKPKPLSQPPCFHKCCAPKTIRMLNFFINNQTLSHSQISTLNQSQPTSLFMSIAL